MSSQHPTRVELSRPPQHDVSGATLLEFLLVALVVVTMLVGIMDLSRYYSVRGALAKGAYDGLSVAKVIQDFTIDTANISNVDGPVASHPDYLKFNAAREQIISAAVSFPTHTFVPNNGESSLRTYQLFDGVRTLDTQVLVLRPGDAGSYDGTNIYHPTICPQNMSECVSNGGRYRKPAESMEQLFRDHPIIVEMRASFSPVLPIFGTLPVQAKAVGYRELSRRSLTQSLPAMPPVTTLPSGGASSSSSGEASSSGAMSSAAQSSSSSCGITANECRARQPEEFCVYNEYTCCKNCVPGCKTAEEVEDATEQCIAEGCTTFNAHPSVCACTGCCTPRTCPEGFTFDSRPAVCDCVSDIGHGGGS